MSVSLNKLIAITSNVVDSSVSGIDLVGTVLTKNALIPFNATQKVLSFTSLELVGEFFGITSDEYLFATNYFSAADNSANKPKFINFARYVDTAIVPYIRGNAMSIDKLSTLNSISNGALYLKFDNVNSSVSGIDLSSAKSFSDIANLIQTKLRQTLAETAICIYDSQTQAFSISNANISGTSTVDYAIDASGIGLGTLLKLTQNEGAILSQGSLALSPTDNLNGILSVTKNWVSFTQLNDISQESGYITALEFAKWANDQNNRYVYMLWSSEKNLTIAENSSHIGTVLAQYAYSAICLIYNSYNHAAFFMGIGASINYNELDGTISFASKAQSGLTVSCNEDSEYDALIKNNFNFYADFSSANDHFRFSENGKITGIFKWLDNFYNNVWLVDQIQLTEAMLLRATNKIDYGVEGQSMLKATLDTVMKAALLPGVIQIGNTFDDTQIAQLKQQAGIDISDILSNTGYFIKITPPIASLRANRPAIGVQIWYTNNGSFYTINNTLTYVN